MDNKRLLLFMLIALPLILMWEPLWTFVGRQLGYDMTRKPPTTQVAQDATTQPSQLAVESTTSPDTAPSGPIRALSAKEVSRPIDIGSTQPDHGSYAIGLKLNPRGAGIDGVTLNRYKTSIDSGARYVFQQPYENHA